MAESKPIVGVQEGDSKASTVKVEPFINWLPSARALGTEILPLYQAELNRAASAHNLGHFDEANSILSSLLAGLESILPNQTNEVEAALFHLLYATVLAAMGRTYSGQGQEKQARNAFRKAVAEFSEWIERAPDQPAQVYCDYGISLFKTGSRRRTIRALELAQTKGALSAEAYRYLGSCYCHTGDFKKADECFTEALRQEPGDFLTRKALAECLEKQGRISEAVNEYNQVALFMATAARFDDAQSILKHVMKLDSKDQNALSFMGEILLNRGLYEETLEAMDEGLHLQPRNGSAVRVKGRALYALGKYDDAVKNLRRALKLDPTLEDARVELALALNDSGDFKGALKVLDEALDARPDNLQALIAKGSALTALGQNEQALAVMDKALEIAPDNAQALGIKGQILNELKQYKKAVRVLKRSIKIDPNNLGVYVAMSTTLLTMGDSAGALEALDNALAIKPDYTTALTYKGEILRVLGRDEEALQVLNQALALQPDDAWALGTKGQVLNSLGRKEEAVQTFQKCLESDSSLMWAHGELITILYSLDWLEETLKALDEALKHQPYTNWLAFKGHVLNDIAEFKAAIKVLDQAIEFQPKFAQVFGLKGWALENLGSSYAQKSLEAFQSAEKLDPQTLLWQAGVADAFYLMQDTEKALDKYRAVIEQARPLVESDRKAENLSIIGWSEYRLGNFKVAAQLFIEILSITPDSISDMFNLALVLMCDKNYEQALREYKRVLRLVGDKPPLARRGLVWVALDDLRLAIKFKPSLAEIPSVKEAVSLLETTYDELPRYKSSTTRTAHTTSR